MALATVATVAGLAMEFGPTVLRGIGSFFDGEAKAVANKVANAVEDIDKIGRLDPKTKQHHLEQVLHGMPSKDLLALEEIKIKLEAEKTRRLELELADEQARHREAQQTIRSGDQASDEYVRHTRPKAARLSLYASFLYLFVFEGLSAFDHGAGVSLELLAVVISPLIGYMGARTWDKRNAAKHGKAGLDGIKASLASGVTSMLAK